MLFLYCISGAGLLAYLLGQPLVVLAGLFAYGLFRWEAHDDREEAEARERAKWKAMMDARRGAREVKRLKARRR